MNKLAAVAAVAPISVDDGAEAKQQTGLGGHAWARRGRAAQLQLQKTSGIPNAAHTAARVATAAITATATALLTNGNA